MAWSAMGQVYGDVPLCMLQPGRIAARRQAEFFGSFFQAFPFWACPAFSWMCINLLCLRWHVAGCATAQLLEVCFEGLLLGFFGPHFTWWLCSLLWKDAASDRCSLASCHLRLCRAPSHHVSLCFRVSSSDTDILRFLCSGAGGAGRCYAVVG